MKSRTKIIFVVIALVALGVLVLFVNHTVSKKNENKTYFSQEGTTSTNIKEIEKIKVTSPITSNVPILVYHSIGPKTTKIESKMQLHYRVTTENFEKQMQYLKDNNFTPITFAQLVDHLNYGTSIPEKAVVITFDDGWKNQYTYAVPILKKYGFTATFFIISKTRSGGYMTWDELKDLVTHHFEIASHTERHAKLGGDITDALLQQEVVGSKQELEKQLGVTVATIAYPYYSQSERARKAIADAGYLGARAGWAKFKNSTDHVFELVSQEVVSNPNPFSSTRLAD